MTRPRARRRTRTAGLLAILVAMGGLTAAPSAQADNAPSNAELLTQCGNGTKTCVFHPTGTPDYYLGDRHKVGNMAYNCTQDPQLSSISWADTTGETNSLGTTMTAELEFSEEFSASVAVSFTHTWSNSHTETQTTMLNVPPGDVGWVDVETKMQKVKGIFELVFDKPYDGQRYWYVPFWASGPVVDGSSASAKTQMTRPMTAKERSTSCKGGSGS